MSQQSGVLDITFKAAIGLSGSPYHVVKLCAIGTPHGVVVTTAKADIAVGFLQNEPKYGENAVVRVCGTSKAKVGTPIASPIGVLVTSGADGRIIPQAESIASGTPYYIGMIMEGDNLAADDIVEVLIIHVQGQNL